MNCIYPSASDVYYRDDIGNISTSALRFLEDSVEVELRPRFPLFGGWKTHYVLGYNVPSYEYLFSKGDNFVLNMRLLDHIFDDMLVEDLTLKIILPEGSQVCKAEISIMYETRYFNVLVLALRREVLACDDFYRCKMISGWKTPYTLSREERTRLFALYIFRYKRPSSIGN